MLIIEKLKRRGIEFEHGLSIEEVDKIERIYEIEFSEEFKRIYMNSVPVSIGFWKWRDFSNKNIEFIKNGIRSTKERMENRTEELFWSDNWEKEPVDPNERIKRIKEKLKAAPKLIPIWGHRYIVSGRMEQSPVVSIVGADIIYYGENLEQYLEIDFDGKRRADILQCDKIKKVPFWSDIIW